MKKTRNNLVVSLDERGKDGDVDVLKLLTTATPMIIVEGMAPKVSVHLDDLQEALNDIREFLKNRPEQPKGPSALTKTDLNNLEATEKKASEEVQQVLDLSN